jgi:hypothetical protein
LRALSLDLFQKLFTFFGIAAAGKAKGYLYRELPAFSTGMYFFLQAQTARPYLFLKSIFILFYLQV